MSRLACPGHLARRRQVRRSSADTGARQHSGQSRNGAGQFYRGETTRERVPLWIYDDGNL